MNYKNVINQSRKLGLPANTDNAPINLKSIATSSSVWESDILRLLSNPARHLHTLSRMILHNNIDVSELWYHHIQTLISLRATMTEVIMRREAVQINIEDPTLMLEVLVSRCKYPDSYLWNSIRQFIIKSCVPSSFMITTTNIDIMTGK